MENVKIVTNQTIEEEERLVDAMLEEEAVVMDNLNKALNSMKGHEVVVDSWGGVIVQEVYHSFDFSFLLNCKGQMLLDLRDENEEIPSFTIKLLDINDIIFDDNLDNLTGELAEGESEYYCEDIVFTINNFLKIRAELQW